MRASEQIITVGGRGGLGGPSLPPYSTGFTKANTSTLRSIVTAGARNAIIHMPGDSLTAGQSAGVGTAQAINSPSVKLAAALAAAGYPSASSNGFCDRGSWGLAQNIANFLTGDGRFGATAAMALGSVKASGGNAFSCTAAGTLTFTAVGDTCEFFWRDGPTGRNLTWNVDGGGETAINSTNVTQLAKTVIPLGSVGAHTVTITWALGSTFPIAFNTYDSTRKEISVWNHGICGGTSANLIDDADAVASRFKMISNALSKADAAIICVCTNDWRTSVLVADFKNNLIALVQAYQGTGATVILRIPPFDPSSTGNAANQGLYIDAIYEVGVLLNVPVVNVRLRWGSNAAAVAAGFQPVNDVHPTTAGYLDEATYVLAPAIQYALAA